MICSLDRSLASFSRPLKPATSIFTHERSNTAWPAFLYISGIPIPCSQRHKLRGILFDSLGLTWRSHIKHFRLRCQTRIDIIKVAAGPRFRVPVLNSYFAIRLTLGVSLYGLPQYSSASPSLLSPLDVLHSIAACLFVGTWRSNPMASANWETGFLRPDHYREERFGHCLLQLLSHPPSHLFHASYPFIF